MRRLAFTIVLILTASGCRDADGDPRGWFGRGDGRTVAVSAGDAELDASGRLNFEVTSDVYRRWTLAQQALGRSEIARYVAALGRRALTQEELDTAVARVQGDARARSAIEGAGMSPLEYVYATVAIEQAMAVASGRLAPRRNDGGVPRQNVEIVGRHQEEILRGGVIGDTTVMVAPVPTPAEPYPPLPQPSPAPLPQPLPTPTPTPQPEPVPAPTPQPTPQPSPQPTPDPSPQPTPDPDPAPPPPAAGARGALR